MLSKMLRAATFKPISSGITATFLQSAVSTANASAYTFSSQNIGADSAGRVVVVGVSPFNTTAGTITSVTIGGVSATEISVGSSSAGAIENCGIFAAEVTGTTATIVVNTSASRLCCGIAVWTLSNATGYSTETFQEADANTAASITNTFSNVTEGDAIIVMGRIRAANVGTYTLSGVTEDMERVVESATSGQFGGSTSITSDQTNYDVTIATSGSSPATNYAIARFFIP
jgi:hypothetical protein